MRQGGIAYPDLPSPARIVGSIVLPGAVDPATPAPRRAGKSVVCVGYDGTGADCSAVLADCRAGAREAVTHLIGHGHERIAFAGHLAIFDVRERHEGYREACSPTASPRGPTCCSTTATTTSPAADPSPTT